MEATSRVLTWFGYERLIHGLKASSLRQKKAAVRDWHVARGQTDPFIELPSVSDWLSCLEKLDGPAKPKIPVPISLLKFIIETLSAELMADQALITALCVGYWFLLRASEYLATDSGLFDPDRAVSWNDLFFRYEDNDGNVKLASPKEAAEALDKGLEVSATLTLFSNKNRLGTCTRSVVSTPNSSLCPVAALLKQHASFKKHMGREPKPEESIFVKDLEGEVFRRKDISAALKAAAQLAGIPDALVGSHSLRRGGASAYIASGASDDDVMRQGRWTSEAYRAYVFPSLDKLKDALRQAQVKVPRFEKN
jgi:integrase